MAISRIRQLVFPIASESKAFGLDTARYAAHSLRAGLAFAGGIGASSVLATLLTGASGYQSCSAPIARHMQRGSHRPQVSAITQGQSRVRRRVGRYGA